MNRSPQQSVTLVEHRVGFDELILHLQQRLVQLVESGLPSFQRLLNGYSPFAHLVCKFIRVAALSKLFARDYDVVGGYRPMAFPSGLHRWH